MKKRKKDLVNNNKPILRLRIMASGVGLLALLIAVPLMAVWKQVYINTASLKMNSMADSLVVLRKEVATLKLRYERSSSSERIERLARESLQLEYPVSSQIVLIDLPPEKKAFSYGTWEVLSFIRKTLGGGRG